MRRFLSLAIIGLLVSALSGCIVVPARHGYYGGGYYHDHGYRDRGGR